MKQMKGFFLGSLPFFDSSGYAAFSPEKWDEIFGEWLKL